MTQADPDGPINEKLLKVIIDCYWRTVDWKTQLTQPMTRPSIVTNWPVDGPDWPNYWWTVGDCGQLLWPRPMTQPIVIDPAKPSDPGGPSWRLTDEPRRTHYGGRTRTAQPGQACVNPARRTNGRWLKAGPLWQLTQPSPGHCDPANDSWAQADPVGRLWAIDPSDPLWPSRAPDRRAQPSPGYWPGLTRIDNPVGGPVGRTVDPDRQTVSGPDPARAQTDGPRPSWITGPSPARTDPMTQTVTQALLTHCWTGPAQAGQLVVSPSGPDGSCYWWPSDPDPDDGTTQTVAQTQAQWPNPDSWARRTQWPRLTQTRTGQAQPDGLTDSGWPSPIVLVTVKTQLAQLTVIIVPGPVESQWPSYWQTDPVTDRLTQPNDRRPSPGPMTGRQWTTQWPSWTQWRTQLLDSDPLTQPRRPGRLTDEVTQLNPDGPSWPGLTQTELIEPSGPIIDELASWDENWPRQTNWRTTVKVIDGRQWRRRTNGRTMTKAQTERPRQPVKANDSYWWQTQPKAEGPNWRTQLKTDDG